MDREFQALQILEQVSALASEDVSNFLDQVCGADADLRNYLESLLATRERAKGFLSFDECSDETEFSLADCVGSRSSTTSYGAQLRNHPVMSVLFFPRRIDLYAAWA
jgi:hypothetical protein